MFGISGTELLIILFFGFLIFGPDKLPQMGRTVGRAIRQFKEASEAANKKFKEEVADPFQEAIAPYKDQFEDSAGPIQEDIKAISQTLNDAKSTFTDPFKDIFGADEKSLSKPNASGLVVGSVANDSADKTTTTPAESSDASNNAEESQELVAANLSEGKPLPQNGGTVKKDLASSLYGLDDEKDGE